MKNYLQTHKIALNKPIKPFGLKKLKFKKQSTKINKIQIYKYILMNYFLLEKNAKSL